MDDLGVTVGTAIVAAWVTETEGGCEFGALCTVSDSLEQPAVTIIPMSKETIRMIFK